MLIGNSDGEDGRLGFTVGKEGLRPPLTGPSPESAPVGESIKEKRRHVSQPLEARRTNATGDASANGVSVASAQGADFPDLASTGNVAQSWPPLDGDRPERQARGRSVRMAETQETQETHESHDLRSADAAASAGDVSSLTESKASKESTEGRESEAMAGENWKRADGRTDERDGSQARFHSLERQTGERHTGENQSGDGESVHRQGVMYASPLPQSGASPLEGASTREAPVAIRSTAVPPLAMASLQDVQTPNECEVAIVGAGPAGLLLANVLQSRGVDFVLLDHSKIAYPKQESTIRPEVLETLPSQAIFLNAESLDILHNLNLLEKVAYFSRPLLGCSITQNGSMVYTVDRFPSSFTTRNQSGLIIPQWRLEQILAERIQDQFRIFRHHVAYNIVINTAPVSGKPPPSNCTSDQALHSPTKGGKGVDGTNEYSEGAQEESSLPVSILVRRMNPLTQRPDPQSTGAWLKASIVVGADGVKSIVRRALGLTYNPVQSLIPFPTSTSSYPALSTALEPSLAANYFIADLQVNAFNHAVLSQVLENMKSGLGGLSALSGLSNLGNFPSAIGTSFGSTLGVSGNGIGAGMSDLRHNHLHILHEPGGSGLLIPLSTSGFWRLCVRRTLAVTVDDLTPAYNDLSEAGARSGGKGSRRTSDLCAFKKLKTPTNEEVLATARQLLPDIQIEAVTWRTAYRCSSVMTDRMVRECAVLIGDAARNVSPLFSLGLNQALRDAFTLGTKFPSPLHAPSTYPTANTHNRFLVDSSHLESRMSKMYTNTTSDRNTTSERSPSDDGRGQTWYSVEGVRYPSFMEKSGASKLLHEFERERLQESRATIVLHDAIVAMLFNAQNFARLRYLEEEKAQSRNVASYVFGRSSLTSAILNLRPFIPTTPGRGLTDGSEVELARAAVTRAVQFLISPINGKWLHFLQTNFDSPPAPAPAPALPPTMSPATKTNAYIPRQNDESIKLLGANTINVNGEKVIKTPIGEDDFSAVKTHFHSISQLPGLKRVVAPFHPPLSWAFLPSVRLLLVAPESEHTRVVHASLLTEGGRHHVLFLPILDSVRFLQGSEDEVSALLTSAQHVLELKTLPTPRGQARPVQLSRKSFYDESGGADGRRSSTTSTAVPMRGERDDRRMRGAEREKSEREKERLWLKARQAGINVRVVFVLSGQGILPADATVITSEVRKACQRLNSLADKISPQMHHVVIDYQNSFLPMLFHTLSTLVTLTHTSYSAVDGLLDASAHPLISHVYQPVLDTGLWPQLPPRTSHRTSHRTAHRTSHPFHKSGPSDRFGAALGRGQSQTLSPYQSEGLLLETNATNATNARGGYRYSRSMLPSKSANGASRPDWILDVYNRLICRDSPNTGEYEGSGCCSAADNVTSTLQSRINTQRPLLLLRPDSQVAAAGDPLNDVFARRAFVSYLAKLVPLRPLHNPDG